MRLSNSGNLSRTLPLRKSLTLCTTTSIRSWRKPLNTKCKNGEKPRNKFTPEELKAFFESTVFCEGLVDISVYWASLLTLFAVGGEAEILQLSSDDITKDGDLWVASIKGQLKTEHRQRIVPSPAYQTWFHRLC